MVGKQQIGEADDGGQHIVEIVRNSAGELTDRLHLLALRKLLLERPLLGGFERIDDRRILPRIRLHDRTDEEAHAPFRLPCEPGIDRRDFTLPRDGGADRRRNAGTV